MQGPHQAALGRALALGYELPVALAGSPSARWETGDWARLAPAVPRSPAVAAGQPAPVDRALARYHHGDLAGAIAELERAVGERPSYADLRCRLAGLLLESGRIDEALEHLDVALLINPRYLEARLLSARARPERGEVDEAVRMTEAAVEAYPD